MEKRLLTVTEEEYAGNLRNLHYNRLMFFIICIVTVLDAVGVFTVDFDLIKYNFIACFILALIPQLLHKIGECSKKAWFKYFILFCSTGIVVSCMTFLTYHAMLVTVAPILFASMYNNKKVVYAAYGMEIVGIVVATYLGYFYGLCDANIVLLTETTLANHLNADGTFALTEINPDPMTSLFIFYCVPRIMISYVYMALANSISDVINDYAQHSAEMKRLSEIDEMTRLFNRNKYMEIVENRELEDEDIAIIFFDVNHLKKVNDSYGHEYGDVLIKKVADSIYNAMNRDSAAYRIGGDEFVMIMQDATLERVEATIDRWQYILNREKSMTKLPISVAMGYAIGHGSNLEALVKDADQQMYQNKERLKAKEGAFVYVPLDEIEQSRMAEKIEHGE